MHGYHILGATVGADFDWGSLIKTGAGAGVEIAQSVEAQQKKEAAERKAKVGEAEALSKSLVADREATEALAAYLRSSRGKLASESADKTLADVRAQVQDEAARGLSGDNQKKRADNARDVLTRATNDLRAAVAGRDKVAVEVAQAKVDAAQVTYGKTQNAILVAQGTGLPPAPPSEERSWFVRPVIGPIPGVIVLIGGILLGGAALAGVAALVRR